MPGPKRLARPQRQVLRDNRSSSDTADPRSATAVSAQPIGEAAAFPPPLASRLDHKTRNAHLEQSRRFPAAPTTFNRGNYPIVKIKR